MDTSDFLDSIKTVHFKPLNTVEDFANHQWLAKEASVSQDGKTVAVKILPVVSTNKVCIPVFDDSKWYSSIGDFKTLDSFTRIPNLTGDDSDFHTDYPPEPEHYGSNSFTIFSNFEKINFPYFGTEEGATFLMLLYGANKPTVCVKDGTVADLQYGTVLPLNLTFTGVN